MGKKYIVIGDWVYSKDGDKHFVSPQRLALLYGLNPDECVLADITRPSTLLGLPELPRLYPRSDGEYTKIS
jgi:hypothetical protein